MKKLLIAMTAAAVGTCAWAEGSAGGEGQGTTPATPAMLSESFSTTWTPAAPWWSYTGDATAELAATNVPTVTDANNIALYLNTGSKVLSGNFGGIGADDKPVAVTIPAGRDTGLYFKSTVIFSDPSDTLPELGSNDKFALVVLDNIESVEEGSNTTNLWVIAGHKTDGKRAYLLQPFANDDDDYNLTDSWFDTPKTIEVRAIQNVMATGNLAGFIVKVGTVICRVVKSYPIVNDVIDMSPSAAEGTTYLGYSAEEIDATYRKRYETDKTLIVSAAASSTLTSVDFQGQGVIDDVSLATTGSNFGTDSLAIAVTADEGVTLKNCADGTLYYSGTSAEITFGLDDGYKLKGVSTNAVEGVDGVYLLTIDPTLYTDGFKVEAFLPVVSVVVGEETLEFGSLAEALESDSVAAGSELKLTAGYTVTEAIAINKNITINLNGQKLSATLTEELESMFELAGGVTLTITDTEGGVLEVISDGDRTLAIASAGGTTVAINKGTIDAAAVADPYLTYNITGGKFLKAANASITVDTGKYVVDADTEADYYIVKDKPAAPSTFAVTYNAGNFTITKDDAAFTSGTELANGTYTFKVAAAERYDIVSVTVGGNAAELTDGAFSVSVNGAAVAIVVTTREVKYPESEDLVEGDVTTDVAEALDELATALGGDTAVTNYITQVCGGTVNAATLTAAKTAGTIGLSVDYDLPLMADVPTVSEIEAEAVGADDAAVFSFQINVNATPIEIKQVTDKVRSMIEYGTSLNGMNALTPQDTGVELELSGSTIKVKLLKQNGVKSGFMKVKLNK